MSIRNCFQIIPPVKKAGSGLAPGTLYDTLDRTHLKSILQNGVNRYIHPLIRVTFKLCKEYKSSHGLRDYIQKYLVNFARENPSITVYVMPRRHRAPQILAEYSTGNIESLDVKDYTAEDIHKWVHYFKTSSGFPVSQIINDIHTENSSIQGIWNPFLNMPTDFNVKQWPVEKYSKVESLNETATGKLLNLNNFYENH